MWKKISGHRLSLLTLVTIAFASSCKTPSPQDTSGDSTPPGFVQIRAVYQRVSDGLEVGSEVIPAAGFTRANLSRDNRIVLGVSVGDSESGVQSIRIEARTKWTCELPGDELGELKQGTLDPRSDEERNGTAAAGTPPIRNAHFTIDPFDRPSRLVCRSTENASSLDVQMTIRATNGKGLEATSAPITFTYLPRPATP